MRQIKESYRRIHEPDDRFDITFWQAEGDQAIFEAALRMLRDYMAIRMDMLTSPDFKELLKLLKKRRVRYLVVGGYAVMKYSEPSNPANFT